MNCCPDIRPRRQAFRASAMKLALLVLAIPALAFMASDVLAGEPIRLTQDGRPKRDPIFTNAAGTELIYSVLEKPNQLRLMKLTLSTGESVALHPMENRSEFEPAVSSDGRFIVYVQNRGNLTLALVIHDILDHQSWEVPPGGGFSGMRSPTFTPDKSRVYYSYPEEGRQQIYSVDLKGKNRQTIIDSEGVNNWPSFAPDGRTFVFGSSRDDDYEIYEANADGTAVRRLTSSPRQDLRPRYSPVGTRIAFTSNRDENYEIYLMNRDGSRPVRVTNHPEQDDYPAWHPDGKRLIIVSERNGAFDLYQIDVPQD